MSVGNDDDVFVPIVSLDLQELLQQPQTMMRF